MLTGTNVKEDEEGPVSCQHRTDTDEEHLVPDDRPPSKTEMRSGFWLACTGFCIVAGLLLSALILGIRFPMNRHKILQYFFFRKSDFRMSIAVLSSGTLVDEEMYVVAKHALKEYKLASKEEDIELHFVDASETPGGFILAFDRLWDEGIRVFLAGGESSVLNELCHHLQHVRKPSLIISPTAFKPQNNCHNLITFYPEHGALLAAELARIKENDLRRVIPIVSEENTDLLPELIATGKSLGLQIEEPFQLQPNLSSLPGLHKKLFAKPRAAIWLSLGKMLPQLFNSVSNMINGHFVMVHSHPNDLSKLLDDPLSRRLAEQNAICSTEWAGTANIGSVSRRRLLGSLQSINPLTGVLSYDASYLAIFAATHHLTNRNQFLQLKAINMPFVGITSLDDILKERTSGFVTWKRLVMKQLLGKEILQGSPWLVEGFAKVYGREGKPWSVIQQLQSPVQIVTKQELKLVTEKMKCNGEFEIKVKVHDPLSHRPITASWPLSEAPHAMMLPNGSPNGFTLRTLCKDEHDTQIQEIGCQGTQSHNETTVCITVSENSSDRRSVRSTVSKFGYPVRRRKNPYRRQQQENSVYATYKEIKKFVKKEEIRNLIPQIGGCIGAAGGCAFCYIYLHFVTVAINPGVCFGACGVAVGGSCSTLLSRGIQYHLDHSVICTELFTQGRLSLSSYFADASYGTRLGISSPRALRGYQTIAAPLVAIMQVSPAVTSAVEVIAQPWMRHMEYEEGLRAEDDAVGSIMTRIGLPICCFVASVIDHIDTIALVTLIALLRRSRT